MPETTMIESEAYAAYQEALEFEMKMDGEPVSAAPRSGDRLLLASMAISLIRIADKLDGMAL